MKVPLHIQNLDEHLTSVRLWCRVYGKYLDGHYDAVEGGPFPLVVDANTGNIETIFEFPMNIDRARADPRDIDKYACNLYIETNYDHYEIKRCTDDVGVYVGNPTAVKRIAVADTTKPCVVHIEGTITGQ